MQRVRKRGQRQMRQKQACIAKSHTSYYSLSEKNKDLALI
jgi:hypothetical protein